MRTRVYVDGFNLYYGALKGTDFKWLDLVQLAYLLVPEEHRIDRLRYFSARVSGKVDSGAPARQHAYLKALQSIPEVRTHMGRFLAKSVWRPVTNLPIANQHFRTPERPALPAGDLPIEDGRTLTVGHHLPPEGSKKERRKSKPLPNAVVAEVHTMEEKGSDVNLGAFLLNDAWKGSFDAALVVSNDTDLVTPIRMVSAEQRKTVIVACPGRWQIAPRLKDVATHVRHIGPGMLRKAQFPDHIPRTNIKRPVEW